MKTTKKDKKTNKDIKKKVLFVAHVDSHILHFHLPYLEMFQKHGYETHVATESDEPIPFCDVKHKIDIKRSPFKPQNLKAIKQLRKIIEEEKFDIIHCHTPMGGVVARLAAKNARKNGTRVIYTAHGFHFYTGAPLLNWVLFYPVEKYLAKYTDTLITINDEDYQRAKQKFSKRCTDIKYVPGVGVDPKKFDFEMSEREKLALRKSLGLKKDDFVIIYVAELNKNKNQIMAIKAMREVVKKKPNYKLLLVGTGVLEEKYKKIVAEWGLHDNVIFAGYRKDAPKLLKISNLAISTSKREGLPLNLIEAQMAGLPVIATDCRGNRDVCAYILPYRSSILASQIQTSSRPPINNQQTPNYSLNFVKSKMMQIYFKKKMVLHILASNKYSGAENVALQIIRNTQQNFRHIYCSPRGEIKEKLSEYNIEYRPIDRLRLSEIKKAIKVVDPDIVHAHDCRATIFCALAVSRQRLISHIHGNNKTLNHANLKSLLLKIAFWRANTIIWVSKSSYSDFFNKTSIKSKSIIIPNVINYREVLEKSKVPYPTREKFNAVFLGRLDYPKDPERALEIAKLVTKKENSLKLALIGDGPQKGRLAKLIKSYNLQDNVQLLGYLDNPFPILAGAKVLLMTSVYEGTPMSALEAKALGLKIVATPVDGLLDLVKTEMDGFLSDDNEELAASLLNFLKKDTLNKSASKKIESSSRAVYQEKHYYSQITNIYNGKIECPSCQ